VGFTNPKTLAFYVAVLPQFVRSGAGPAALQTELFGLTFNVLALVNDSLWALAAGTARDWFVRRPQRTQRLAAAGGTMMIGLGVALAAAGSTR
jgi:threonine/homoserine/homoserine lactone efflux protein